MKNNESVFIGRNRNDKVFHQGDKLFRKYIDNSDKDGYRRFKNILMWDKIRDIQSIQCSPKIKSHDTDNLIIDFEWVDHAFSIQDILVNGEPQKRREVFIQAVKIISKIHSINPSKYDLDVFIPARGIGIVFGIDITTYSLSSGGELELFGILHSDRDLFNSIDYLLTLRRKRLEQETVISHGDLRLDQFIPSNEKELLLIDFEELCLAYPEFDLGSLFASLVFSRVYDVLTTGSQESSNSAEINDFFLENGSAVLLETISEIRNLTSIYSESRGVAIDMKLLNLEIGWSIIERLISRSKLAATLATIDKAIAGIARSMLLQPDLIEEIAREKEEKIVR